MSAEYAYRCIDRSILLPTLKQYYFSVYFKLVPQALTANFITLISSAAMWIMLTLLMNREYFTIAALAAYSAFLIHAYVVGDHLDGMQAKETKTSSPLGEFLDHYFDIYNSGITVLGFFVLMKVESHALYFVTLFSFYVAFAATILEEKIRGEIVFAPIGSLESVIVTIMIYLSLSFPAGQRFWSDISQGAIDGYQNYWILAISVDIGCMATFFAAIFRSKKLPLRFVGYLTLNLLLIYYCSAVGMDKNWGWFLFASLNGSFVGKLMESHLCKSKIQGPHYLFIITVLVLFLNQIFSFFSVSQIGLRVIILGLCLKTVLDFSSTFIKLKSHWIWKNPTNAVLKSAKVVG